MSLDVYLKWEFVVLKSSVVTDVSPNAKFLSSPMSGKHVWINASNAKDLSERIRHFHSAFVEESHCYLCLCVDSRQYAGCFAIVEKFSCDPYSS